MITVLADSRKRGARAHAFVEGEAVSACRLWARYAPGLSGDNLSMRTACATCWARLGPGDQAAFNLALEGDVVLERLAPGGRSRSSHLFAPGQPAALCRRVARAGCVPAGDQPVCGRCSAAGLRVGA